MRELTPQGHGPAVQPVTGGFTDVTKCAAMDCTHYHNARDLGYGSPSSTRHVSQHPMDTSTVTASTLQVLLSHRDIAGARPVSLAQ